MPLLPALPCYLNGAYTTLDKAHISVMDRGFIFGDGVYEVIPIYQGEPFRLGQHLTRLARSLEEVRIANPLTDAQWQEIAHALIGRYAQHPLESGHEQDQLIYIQITRGVAMRDHVMPTGITPTVFVMINAMKQPSDSDRAHGVACVSAEDFRWERAHIKSTSLLGAVFARQLSHDVGAAETIMFRGGFLSEAAACNVWVVKDGHISGTPKDNLVLEGIRYGLMEELCARLGIGLSLRRVSQEEVLDADELLLTSATKEVLAISHLDDHPVGAGHPGPVYAKLFDAYQQAKAQSRTPKRAPQ